jgi:hypothetical protein
MIGVESARHPSLAWAWGYEGGVPFGIDLLVDVSQRKAIELFEGTRSRLRQIVIIVEAFHLMHKGL